MAVFVFINIQVLALNNDQEVVTEEEGKINKPAVLLTKEIDGELDHPLFLKAHKIQRVPIRPSTIDDDIRGENSRSTFKSEQDYSLYRRTHSDGKFEHAITHYRAEKKIVGVQARINLWQPLVINRKKAYSSSHIWIVSNDNRNVIEAGWHRDEEGQSGCYNLDCEGFKQNEDVDRIGKSYDEVSSYDDIQHTTTIKVVKSRSRRGWLLEVDGREVGVWPNEMFSDLRDGAAGVYWGGETWIMNRNDGDGDGDGDDDGEDTSVVEMGSGRFAEEGYNKASYFDKLRVALVGISSAISVTPNNWELKSTSPCYTIRVKYNSGGEANNDDDNKGFFYGGPGVGPSCPTT
ncbi:uncharacterized protein LOC120010580 [Tripterygium wilfordii]|uniref:uncharacterized protein LOC120010580 n=1 Tax=Tripterygium wilfordii TaxID=458696 RepID=UPI0018F85671|nr:uncharacterized protein LOC120010580 [Tripterygium wilfordii]